MGELQPPRGHIRLNTELVKKPKDLLEYVVVHEMVHLIEPTHSERFVAILGRSITQPGVRPAQNSTSYRSVPKRGGNYRRERIRGSGDAR